ncbi:MAG: MBL fold metallo-hydrolase [Candidatus Dojkabacteria bacterium]|nr:MBL fold metallo-hydrolase [Candidatus Dojkabacteria bacterium]MDQ7020671.1 MBL fold metallo-hydrolase [Candidatus Dojkabacteria bacterium]
MTSFKILVEGYAHEGKDDSEYFASPTTTLIESNGKKILVDPGADAAKLEKALVDNSVDKSDIDLIYLTHWHGDHVLNIRLFPDVDIYDSEVLWRSNGEEQFPGGKIIPGTEILILKTPGHTMDHTSLLIDTTSHGMVCIAQDVFWWEDGKQKSDSIEDLMNLEDPFVADKEALAKSRRNVLDLASWIIPGHGKMFKNPGV